MQHAVTQSDSSLTVDLPDVEGTALPSLLDGRYELLRHIAYGGMGVVFLGLDTRLKRHVAIKQLHPHIACDPAMRKMFQREAEVMATLRHPNVVAVHDVGGDDEHPYFVMSYHEAHDLEHWAKAHGGPPLPLALALELLDQVCVGIEAMHAAELIHGDIKPRNILVNEQGEVTLVDLGLARGMSTEVHPRHIGGTPGFLAPEIIRRDALQSSLAAKIDVYALGVTAYWMLAGQLPWDVSGAMNVVLQRVQAPPRPLSAIRGDFPAAVEATIAAAIDPQPTRRPGLEQFRSGLSCALDLERAGPPPYIVVVDDDPDMLVLIEAVVRASVDDAQIETFESPRAAISSIRSHEPDLVITDLDMPDMNGIELVAMLRGTLSTASVPIMVVSGVGGASEWQILHGLGADCLVPKPVNPRVLGDVVRSVLASAPDRSCHLTSIAG